MSVMVLSDADDYGNYAREEADKDEDGKNDEGEENGDQNQTAM